MDDSAKCPDSTKRYIRFGNVEIDTARGEVFLNGIKLRLNGKPYRVLTALVDRPGQVLAREELHQRLRPGDHTIKSSDNVMATVSKLRRLLADDKGQQAWIQTVRNRGYALVADLEYSAFTMRDKPTRAGIESARLDIGKDSLRKGGGITTDVTYFLLSILFSAIVAGVFGAAIELVWQRGLSTKDPIEVALVLAILVSLAILLRCISYVRHWLVNE